MPLWSLLSLSGFTAGCNCNCRAGLRAVCKLEKVQAKSETNSIGTMTVVVVLVVVGVYRGRGGGGAGGEAFYTDSQIEHKEFVEGMILSVQAATLNSHVDMQFQRGRASFGALLVPPSLNSSDSCIVITGWAG